MLGVVVSDHSKPVRGRVLFPATARSSVARNPKVSRKKSQDRRPKTPTAGGRPRRGRPKLCIFCRDHVTWVDYKDVALLGRFVNDRGRIKARGGTGTCAQHNETWRPRSRLPASWRCCRTLSEGRQPNRGVLVAAIAGETVLRQEAGTPRGLKCPVPHPRPPQSSTKKKSEFQVKWTDPLPVPSNAAP
jgi:ribosomal protein S18